MTNVQLIEAHATVMLANMRGVVGEAALETARFLVDPRIADILRMCGRTLICGHEWRVDPLPQHDWEKHHRMVAVVEFRQAMMVYLTDAVERL